MVVAHGCNIFHPCHNPACVVVVVTKLLLLLICVIKVVPTIASGSGVSLFFLYWRPNPENITRSFRLNQRQEFYISMYLRTLQISKKLYNVWIDKPIWFCGHTNILLCFRKFIGTILM